MVRLMRSMKTVLIRHPVAARICVTPAREGVLMLEVLLLSATFLTSYSHLGGNFKSCVFSFDRLDVRGSAY